MDARAHYLHTRSATCGFLLSSSGAQIRAEDTESLTFNPGPLPSTAITSEILLPVKIPHFGPCQTDSHPRNEAQTFFFQPFFFFFWKGRKESSRKFTSNTDLLQRSGTGVGGWEERAGQGRAGLPTGSSGCENTRVSYPSTLTLSWDAAEAPKVCL